MKILVIDDTEIHRQAALICLADHEVTVIGSHDEAIIKINGGYVETAGEWKNQEPGQYDAVLCDLLMPAGRDKQGRDGEKLVGTEMAIGWSLALQAVKLGAKFVAVASDMNHHSHPASAQVDHDRAGGIYEINGARVLFTNSVHVDVEVPGTTCEYCHGTGKSSDGKCYPCDATGIGNGKNWAKILEQVMVGPEAE